MRRIRDIRIHPVRRLRSFRAGASESDIIRRVSIAGLVIAFLWLLAVNVVNTDRVGDLIDQSTVEAQLDDQRGLLEDQRESLNVQDTLIEDALVQIGELKAQLQTAAVQSEALMNQLRALNVEPIVIVRAAPPAPSPPLATTTTTDKAPGQNKVKPNQK